MVLIWLLALCKMQAIAQTVPVHTVLVKSVWGGFSPSPPPPVELLIQRQGDNRLYSNGTSVSANLIEPLIQALGAPGVEQPQSSNLGITQRWLEDNIEGARRKNDPLSPYSSDYYWPTFQAAFTNRSLIETVLPSLFSGSHTDDYPGVELQVVFANGDAWSAASNSQYEFMIPWRIKVRGKTLTTWNANLSKAVAALLPDSAVNRGRLNGEFFSYRLGNAMMERIEAQWMSPALSVLRSRYAIERAGIEVRRDSASANGKNGHAEEATMNVRLGSKTLPEWLHIAALLPIHEHTVVGAEDLLRLAPGYENLVLSVPWLNRWLADHEQSVRISFAKGRSFSEEAMAVFDADMKAMGKESLLQEVRAVQEQVALIDVQNSIAYWLVLPDKRMVLWRFHTLPSVAPADSRLGLLKWTQANFTTTERVESWSAWRHCAGSVISAEGNPVQ